MKTLLLRFFAAVYEKQAKKLLNKHKPKIIAVTGSYGKTSTKFAIAKVLEAKYPVLAFEGNYNNELGLPLSLFNRPTHFDGSKPIRSVLRGIRIIFQNSATIRGNYPYKVVVLEAGADKPGDIKRFTKWLKPDLSVITAVAPVHTELFGTVENVLEEKWALAEASKRVLYNAQDQRLQKRATETAVPARSYGVVKGDYHAGDLEFDMEKLAYQFHIATPEMQFNATASVVGRQSLYALVAATAIGLMFHVPQKNIKEKIAQYQQPDGRMKPFRGKKGSLIIDDTYNSSTDAAVAALDALYQFKGRKIAILGSMNELGEYEEEGHRTVGQHAKSVDLLVTIGNAAKEYLIPAAIKAGLKKEQAQITISPIEAAKIVEEQLQEGDVVLVKGSQNGVFAEEAVKLLLEDKKDQEHLVRQSKRWLEIKKQQFPEIEN